MKYFIAMLVFLGVTLSFPNVSHAVSSSAVGVRVVLTAANVGSNTWTSMISSTAKAIKGISVVNYSSTPMELGIALAGAAADSETRQLVIAQQAVNTAATYLPLVVSQGVRISVRALQSNASFGELELNAFYN